MRTVTALKPAGHERVAVELDGQAWRTVPLEAALVAGLAEGTRLDRERARKLARALRRLAAMRTATAALRQRDRSRHELEERLRSCGVAHEERERTLAALGRAGLVDDARFAQERASSLAARGAGDALIRDDLGRRGLADAAIEDAVAALRSERSRAADVIARRGSGRRTARYLAARGFDEEVVALAVAQDDEAALG